MSDPTPNAVTLDQQRAAWNAWNAQAREQRLHETCRRQAYEVERWLDARGIRNADVLDAGCGTGWMSERLMRYGRVTGIDIADEVVERARARVPQVRFVTGDLAADALEGERFDAIVSLEVLSHVPDQRRFVGKLARLLRPGGTLVIATQNRPVFERWSAIGEPIPGTIRQWLDARELRALLSHDFQVDELISVVPIGDRGFLRIVNSAKLNLLANALFGPGTVERVKERAMLGQTLMVAATRL